MIETQTDISKLNRTIALFSNIFIGGKNKKQCVSDLTQSGASAPLANLANSKPSSC